MNIEFNRDTVRADLKDLHQQLEGGFADISETHVAKILHEGGYSESLADIRYRISILITDAIKRLAELPVGVEPLGRLARRMSVELEAEIITIQQDMTQLTALVARTLDLITMVQTTVKSSQSASAMFIKKGIAAAKGWLSVAKSWIGRICGQIWNLVAGLLTPKEWSIGGDVGTGALGLGNVKLEIKFGP